MKHIESCVKREWNECTQKKKCIRLLSTSKKMFFFSFPLANWPQVWLHISLCKHVHYITKKKKEIKKKNQIFFSCNIFSPLCYVYCNKFIYKWNWWSIFLRQSLCQCCVKYQINGFCLLLICIARLLLN